jgi:hypothetical protein
MYTKCSKSSSFVEVTFLKNPVNGKTAMRKFKKILENGKNGVRGTKDK